MKEFTFLFILLFSGRVAAASETPISNPITLPGDYFKWVQAASARLEKGGKFKLEYYIVSVFDRGEYVEIYFRSEDTPEPAEGTVCLGSCGSHLDFQAEVRKSDNSVTKFNFAL